MRSIPRIPVLVLCCGLAMCLLFGCGKDSAEAVQVLKDCPVAPEMAFGGVYIQESYEAFGALGFEVGDSVDLSFSNGYEMEDIPYYTGYYTEAGEALVLADEGCISLDVCINYGDSLWSVAGLEEGMTVTVTMHEKAKYLDIQNARDIDYEDDRDLYPSDVVFANFREVCLGEIGEGVLYRSASPCNNVHNRAPYADDLIAEAGVAYILNLADDEEEIAGYLRGEDFDSPYFLSLYEAGKVGLHPMTMNYSSEEFRAETADALRDMTEHPGTYLIHCTEGKDRTGFQCMLLEAFAGAGYQEIVDDYMITYDNYYGINEASDKERYDATVESLLLPMLRELTGEDTDPAQADLPKCAEDYLQTIGLDDREMSALRACLAGEDTGQ